MPQGKTETAVEKYERIRKQWLEARDVAAALFEQMNRAADVVRRENRERDKAAVEKGD